jgi:hypothetical protein
MANHAGRSAQQPPKQPDPPLPVLRWATIARVGESYALATMETQGQRIVSQTLGKPEARHIVEAEFQVYAALNILDREED